MASSVTAFGKYTLLRRIASGGMAEVYLARQEGMAGFAREVAIKRIHEHVNNDPEFISMFLDEARLMSRLSHPNIVSVHEFGREGNAYYMVMEFVDGESLSAAIERSNGVQLTAALRIVSQVCAGLHYAHSLRDDKGRTLGIVHRDVSPQNVLLGFDGSVKLIDFGIAKAETQSHKTRVGTFKGKYSYMAPEQARGKPVDLRVDVHAVGIILWEMLTGRSLYQQKTVFHTMEAVVSMVPSSVRTKDESIPSVVDDIISKALAKSPEDRYQNCAEMEAALEKLVTETSLYSSSLSLGRYVSELFRSDTPADPASEQTQEMTQIEDVELDNSAKFEHRPANPAQNNTAPPTTDMVSREADLRPETDQVSTSPRCSYSPKNRGWGESTAERLSRSPDDSSLMCLNRTPFTDLQEQRVEKTRDSGTRKKPIFPFFLFGTALLVLTAGLGSWYAISNADETLHPSSIKDEPMSGIVVRPVETLMSNYYEKMSPEIDARTRDINRGENKTGAFVLPDESEEFESEISPSFLSVYSTPSGARLILDGRATGERTTVRDLPLDPGIHVVELDLVGHRRWRKRVSSELGQSLRLRATLLPIPSSQSSASGSREAMIPPEDYGMLCIETDPPVRVFKGREHLGRTPLSGVEIPAGNYTLTFVLPNGRRIKKTVNIRAGRTTRLFYKLELQPLATETRIEPNRRSRKNAS